MKRSLAVLLLMLCLSFPAFAGHTIAGGYACTCGTAGCVEDYPGECSGNRPIQQGKTPDNGTAEIAIVMVALLFWLRMRA